MHIIEEYTDKGFKVITGYDDSSWMYDELWDGVSFISNHRGYADEGEMSHIRIESLMEGNIPKGYEIAPITAYIHGGIALTASKNDSYPFNCQWDSGLFGFILFKTGEFGDNNIGLEGFVNYWEAILNGNIYYFTIEDENDIIESCGGFSDMDDMKKEIDNLIDSMVKYQDKQRVEKLKAMIRHKAPLEKRAI